MAYKIPLELVGRAFPTSLVILEGQGIDVKDRRMRPEREGGG
jgi:hypothetical protein